MRDMNVGILEEINEQSLDATAAATDEPVVTQQVFCAPSFVTCPQVSILWCPPGWPDTGV